MRKILISDSAKKDFSEKKTYVVAKFGAIHWNKIASEWHESLKKVANNPELGIGIVELSGTGYSSYYRKYRHKKVYAVYSFNASEIRVHMFIPEMRDFRTHVLNRILAQ